MGTTQLDDEIVLLQRKLVSLPARAAATHAVSCSERLIGFYSTFCEKDHWGDITRIRIALDRVWEFLIEDRVSVDVLRAALEEVHQLTPDVDDFDSMESSVAQDVCVCIDSAIQWCLREDNSMKPIAVAYSLGTLRSIVAVKETGCLDLGDSPQSLIFENSLLTRPLIANELRFQKEDLNDLESSVGASPDMIAHIRRRSDSNRIDAVRTLQGLP